jgi:hypothetical protein
VHTKERRTPISLLRLPRRLRRTDNVVSRYIQRIPDQTRYALVECIRFVEIVGLDDATGYLEQ